MKLRYLFYSLMVLTYLTAISFTGCTTTLFGRAVRWGESDTGDINRFPMRKIAQASVVASFTRNEALIANFSNNEEWLQKLALNDTTAMAVLRNDELVAELYFEGNNPGTLQTSFSVAKSITSLLVGICLDQGLIADVNDPISRYLTQLDTNPKLREITVRQLLTMSSGIRLKKYSTPFLNIWSDGTIAYYSPDLRKAALKIEPEEAPDTSWQYNNYHTILLGMIIEKVSGLSITDFTRKYLWEPLGSEYDASWSLDSAEGFEKMATGFNAAPLDYLKIAAMVLHGGKWNNRQVVSRAWIEESTQPQLENPLLHNIIWGEGIYYTYHWWAFSFKGKLYNFALGDHGQFIFISPEDEIVIVRTGTDLGSLDTRQWLEFLAAICSDLSTR